MTEDLKMNADATARVAIATIDYWVEDDEDYEEVVAELAAVAARLDEHDAALGDHRDAIARMQAEIWPTSKREVGP